MASQQTMEEKEKKNQEYNEYVKRVTPTHSLPANMVKAFVVGGIICVLGQFILNMAAGSFNLDKETAAGWCSVILVFLSVLLTGLNIYPGLPTGEARAHWCRLRVCQFCCGSRD